METVQGVSLRFFLPLFAAYGAALAGWLLLSRMRWVGWPQPVDLRTNRKWLDLVLVFVAAACLFAVSWAYREGYLIPEPSGWSGVLAWNANNLLIYSPIFLVPLVRRQGLDTVYLSARRLHVKLAIGAALGLISVIVFYGVRGELSLLRSWAARAVDPWLLSRYALPVFLEGVALAFVLVRLRWALGRWPSLLIPAVLFAIGHLPRSMEAGESWGYILAFWSINVALVVSILFVLQKSQDVIWLSIPHYLMDIAIRAF